LCARRGKNIPVFQQERLLSIEAGALRSPDVRKDGGAARGEGRLLCPLAPAGRMHSDTRAVPGRDVEPGHSC